MDLELITQCVQDAGHCPQIWNVSLDLDLADGLLGHACQISEIFLGAIKPSDQRGELVLQSEHGRSFCLENNWGLNAFGQGHAEAPFELR